MVYQGARKSLMEAATDRLAHTAELIDLRFAASRSAIRKDVLFLANTPPVQGITRARRQQRTGFMLDRETALSDLEWREQLASIFEAFLESRPAYREAVFFELRGTPRELVRVVKQDGAVVRVPWNRLRTTRTEAYLREASALEPGTLYLSEIGGHDCEDRPGLSPVLHAATPVFSPEGERFGLIVVSVDLKTILAGFADLVSPDKTLYIAGADGQLLFRSDASPPYEHRLQDAFPVAAPLLAAATDQRTRFGIDLDGLPGAGTALIAYFSTMVYDRGIDRHHLILAVTSPHETILAGVRQVRNRSVIITLLFCFGATLLVLGFTSLLTRPLSQITEALSHFGRDGWRARLPTQRRDEFGLLARTFETMEAQIRHQMHQLEDKEQRQRTILETSAEGILVIDTEGRIETFNRAAERLLGYRAEEVLGRRIDRLLAPAPGEEKGDEVLALFREAAGREHEVLGRRKNGETRTFALAVSAFEFGGEKKYTGFLRDITEQKQYEQALEQAKEHAEEMAHLKSAFLANMSHEIRTPLTAVIGYASVLAKEVEGAHREFAELIQTSSKRLMDTLNSVLALAQLEANKLKVELEVLDVGAEVEEVARLFRPMARQRGLALGFDRRPGAGDTRARLDRGALSSILQNLVGNALKFTEQGRITLTVDADDRHVYIHVQDTGVGIDPAFLPHLFDEFRQESTGMSRSHEGSGLGLSITRRLVELMQGEIRVQSRKGEGSTFTVVFPRVVPEPETPPASPDAEPGCVPPAIVPKEPPSAPVRLLVVEDNAENARLAQHVLQAIGSVTVARNAEEALRHAATGAYDLVLMDINLGSGFNGIDVLQKLRTIPACADTPVVALTAYALPGDRERFLELGFTDYLGKPFSGDELLQFVHHVLLEKA
ncbi:PAS domain S-box protein [Rhodocaloribacter litoris]|uniref:ATP-binding protein n=1 Tax=Rhodocaloribacter litoris TaxID=2558931 RepID=UPI001E42C649|nr:ATP-binding protein [Rhodocaloribacter litoris]QXD13962.1 PAS domain S-box protein [Rhodocaloribacter litoris]